MDIDGAQLAVYKSGCPQRIFRIGFFSTWLFVSALPYVSCLCLPRHLPISKLHGIRSMSPNATRAEGRSLSSKSPSVQKPARSLYWDMSEVLCDTKSVQYCSLDDRALLVLMFNSISCGEPPRPRLVPGKAALIVAVRFE